MSDTRKIIKVKSLIYISLIIGIILFFILNLVLGSVNIPLADFANIFFARNSENIIYENILINSRLPQSITAMLAGSGLAAGGMMMQTLFRNPLAGPSILGISSGASLGVAFVMMFSGSWGAIIIQQSGIYNNILPIIGAFIGAMAALTIILLLSRKIPNNALLLIAGIMLGYLTSAMIDVLKFYGFRDNVHSFVLWGLGNFSNVTWTQLNYYIPIILLGLLFSLILIKPLDIMQLGDNYAINLGLNIKLNRFYIILCTGILTAIITAFCGPIAFLGLAVPHLVKLMFHTTAHKTLIPAVILSGALVALICNLISRLPGLDTALPINAVTSLFGAPVVISILLRKRNLQY